MKKAILTFWTALIFIPFAVSASAIPLPDRIPDYSRYILAEQSPLADRTSVASVYIDTGSLAADNYVNMIMEVREFGLDTPIFIAWLAVTRASGGEGVFVDVLIYRLNKEAGEYVMVTNWRCRNAEDQLDCKDK